MQTNASWSTLLLHLNTLWVGLRQLQICYSHILTSKVDPRAVRIIACLEVASVVFELKSQKVSR